MIGFLANPEQVIEQDISLNSIEGATKTYSMAIISGRHQEVNWRKINTMLIDKWGLEKQISIKENAWKLLSDKENK